MADNMRSIPSVVDGLKPGQRKVLYTCFKRNLKKDMKVVELAGSISGLTAYQHGEASSSLVAILAAASREVVIVPAPVTFTHVSRLLQERSSTPPMSRS